MFSYGFLKYYRTLSTEINLYSVPLKKLMVSIKEFVTKIEYVKAKPAAV